METTATRRSFSRILKTEPLVLVDFSAEWCGPCKMMKPVLEELKEWAGDQATILKVDVDKNIGAATQYQITGVPTFILFKNNDIVWRHSGAVGLATLKNLMQQHFIVKSSN